jgi:hexosaminidase
MASKGQLHRWGSVLLVLGVVLGAGPGLALESSLAQQPSEASAGLVPQPAATGVASGEFELSEMSLVEMTTAEASSAAEILLDGVRRVTGMQVQLRMARINEQDPASSILLDVRPFDGRMADRAEAYSIQVTPEQVVIRGGDAAGLSMGVARFLQLLRSPLDGKDLLSISRVIPFTVPCVTIIDAPDTEWRGVMIDVARFPHKIADVREVVELAWLTGLNRVHLHLTDDQYFTFPSKAFPELASVGRNGERLHFTRHELLELVEFAHARGVVLVPEVDMPAHAGVMVRARPDLFGTTDPKTGESRSTGIVNMASEKAYEALDVLIGEVCEVFSHSPYIHLGADEVGAGHLRDLPEYDAYVRKHKLTRAIKGDVGELYCHFVARTCEMVRKRDRRPVVWEGFSGAGTKAAPIPSDVLIMAWNLTYQTPDSLIKNGFEIINCGWDPLYVVPAQCWAATVADALNWDVRELRQRLGGPRYTLPDEAPVLGAQMCIWEQRPDAILGASYEVMAAVSERMWNAATPKDEAGHIARRAALDRVVQRMLRPNAMFELSRSGREEFGLLREVPREERAYSWNAAWPIPLGTGKLLDVHEIGVQARGSMAHIDAARVTEVNRELFARVAPLGHIDTRIPAQPQPGLEWLPRRHWQPYAIELDGVIELPKSGEWSFTLRANDGAAELRLADTVVATSRSNRSVQGVGKMDAGLYHFRIKFHFEYVQNELNIQVQGPGMDKPIAFNDLVLTVTEYQAKASESAASTILMAASNLSFQDPSKVIVRSLATGKPIVSSAGHQGPNIPENAVDGILGNESGWHCGSSPSSLTIDLGKEHPINRVQVFPFHDGGRYYQYRVEASPDGKRWSQVVDASSNTALSSAQGDEYRFAVTPARYVRLTMLKNSANPGVHVNELLVFADGAAPGD